MSIAPNNWWDLPTLIGYFEAIPTVEEEYIHTFDFQRGSIRMELVVDELEHFVCMRLFELEVEAPVFEYRICSCDGIRYYNEEFGEFVDFIPGRNSEDEEIPIIARVKVTEDHLCVRILQD